MNLDLREFLASDERYLKVKSQLSQQNSKHRIDDLDLIFPIDFTAEIYKFQEGLELNLNIDYRYRTNCDRCLKPIEKERITDFKVYNMESEDEDLDYFEMEDGQVFLDDIIISEIIMDRPFKNLCDEECLGICPTCGKNLNEETCSCKDELEEEIDPRFAKLKGLFNEEV